MRSVAFKSFVDIIDNVLYQRVLILNRYFVPIHITTVKRAISLLCLDTAVGVDAHYQTYSWEDLCHLNPNGSIDSFYLVHTIQNLIPIPKVLQLQDYDKRPPHYIRFSRSHVFLRDQFTCQYCDQSYPKHELNIDHVIPKTKGGKTTWDNVVTSCKTCNRQKGGRTPREAGMTLKNKPFKPKTAPLIEALKEVHQSWSTFFFASET